MAKIKLTEVSFIIGIFLYLLSIFLLEKTLLLNRISIGLLLISSIVLLSREKVLLSWKVLITQVFFLIPFLYSIIFNCNYSEALLNVVYPVLLIIMYAGVRKFVYIESYIYYFISCLLIVLLIICLIYSTYDLYEEFIVPYGFDSGFDRIKETYWWNNFVHKSLLRPFDIHPSYMASFILLSINWLYNKLYIGVINDKIDYRLILLFLGNLFLLLLVSSKISYIIFFLLSIIFFNRLLAKKRIKELLIVAFTLVICALSFYSLPSIRNRILIDYLKIEKSNFRIDNKSHVSERLFLWNTSAYLIKNQPSGNFCQSTKELIYESLDKQNKVSLTKKNAHNNYLEFGLMYGLIGLIVITSFIVICVIISIKSSSHLLIGEILIFVIFSLVESTLVRELGVIYIAFFIQLRLLIIFNQELKLKHERIT